MATIVKRGKKYSVVYNYTDENGVQQQPQDVLELAKLLSANPALAALLAGILKNGTA